MKITTPIVVCLSILVCYFSDAQDTNKTVEVRHIDLKMDMPGGFGSVLMSEQPTLYLVQLPVGGGSSFEKHPAPDVESLGLQVWLLRADGATISQRDKPTLIGISNAGSDTDYMMYTFARGASDELAGIVLQVKGKLYCREIGIQRK